MTQAMELAGAAPPAEQAVGAPVRWCQRAAAALALGASLAAGGCHPAEAPEAPHASSVPPPAVADAPGAEAAKSKAADLGPLHMGVVIARAKGDPNPKKGFTPANVLQYTQRATDSITAATRGKVRFAPLEFYGNLTLDVPNPQDSCKRDAADGADSTFENNLLGAAERAAEENGWPAARAAGLMVYLDVQCIKPVRSNATGNIFTEQRGVYITNNPAMPVSARTPAHELGHLLGLSGHAGAFTCRSAMPRMVTPKCGIEEYGSPRSLMGHMPSVAGPNGGLDQVAFNGYELYTLGALTREDVLRVNRRGTYGITLQETTSAADGIKLVRVPRAGAAADGGKFLSYYWIELSRAPKQPDNRGACTPQGARKGGMVCEYPQPLGVSIYAGNGGEGLQGGNTALVPLEAKNGPAAGAASENLVGQVVFQDPRTGIWLRLDDINDVAGTAHITLDYAAKQLPVMIAPKAVTPQ